MKEIVKNKNTDGELAEFMADSNYKVTIASADCDKDPSDLIKHLIEQGYEVWPELRTSNNKKCDVIYRKLKEKQ